MVFYLESQGHTKTVVNGKVVDNRGYEAVSNSKGTNLLIKEGKIAKEGIENALNRNNTNPC